MNYNIILSILLLILILHLSIKYRVNNKYIGIIILIYISINIMDIISKENYSNEVRGSMDVYSTEYNNSDEKDVCGKRTNVYIKDSKEVYKKLNIKEKCEEMINNIFNGKEKTGEMILYNKLGYLSYENYDNETSIYTDPSKNKFGIDSNGYYTHTIKFISNNEKKVDKKYVRDKSEVIISDPKPQRWEFESLENLGDNCYVYIRTYSPNASIASYYLTCNNNGKLGTSLYKGGVDQLWELNIITYNPLNNKIKLLIKSAKHNKYLKGTQNTYLNNKQYLVETGYINNLENIKNNEDYIWNYETIDSMINNKKYTGIGSYKDEINSRAMIINKGNYQQNYNGDKCQKECKDYKYFGLQYPNEKTNLSQCYCSNSLEDSTKYGKIECGESGGPNCNYIYHNNEYNDNVGKICKFKNGNSLIRRPPIDCQNNIVINSGNYFKNGLWKALFNSSGQIEFYNNNKLIYKIGNKISSNYNYIYQTDGNFVLYNNNNQAIWGLNINGNNIPNSKNNNYSLSKIIKLTEQGILEVIDNNNNIMWSSK